MERSERTLEFVRLFASHDRVLYKYILTLLPDADAAQEVFQETSVVLWQKFREFQAGSSFSAWACRVAYVEVLKYRQSGRRSRLYFNDELLGQLVESRAAGEDILKDRLRALDHCRQKLPARDRELLDLRYGGKESVQVLAQRLGRPANTLYKTLERIRRVLFRCIDQTLRAEW